MRVVSCHALVYVHDSQCRGFDLVGFRLARPRLGGSVATTIIIPSTTWHGDDLACPAHGPAPRPRRATTTGFSVVRPAARVGSVGRVCFMLMSLEQRAVVAAAAALSRASKPTPTALTLSGDATSRCTARPAQPASAAKYSRMNDSWGAVNMVIADGRVARHGPAMGQPALQPAGAD